MGAERHLASREGERPVAYELHYAPRKSPDSFAIPVALTSSLGGFSWVFPNSPMANRTRLAPSGFPFPAPRQVTGSRLGGAGDREGAQTPRKRSGHREGRAHASGACAELSWAGFRQKDLWCCASSVSTMVTSQCVRTPAVTVSQCHNVQAIVISHVDDSCLAFVCVSSCAPHGP
ncbi:unnamed protein product [Gulo gulo]|uniref:Uncharacterized protein n=1 Tax=Gulo gulo TaxID=48420 RepID=A0A9X9LX79_GULGU|nr:unnamed protein product [Gulo gulo]